MLSVTFWRLVHDHAEIVSALGASSSDVFGHRRRIHIAKSNFIGSLRYGSEGPPKKVPRGIPKSEFEDVRNDLPEL